MILKSLIPKTGHISEENSRRKEDFFQEIELDFPSPLSMNFVTNF